MISQTIALIRYFLSAYLVRKNVLIVLAILVVGYLSSQFIVQLSLSKGVEAQLAFQIEFYRYLFVLFSVLLLMVSVADDYESRQFEILLSMPLHRWQYVIAQMGVIFILNFILCIVAALVVSLQAELTTSLILFVSLWLELVLVSVIALLAIISLEKVPSAVMLTVCLYVLARASDSIVSIVEMSVHYSDQSLVNQAVLYTFKFIQFLLPNTNAYLANDYFFNINIDGLANLFNQALSVLVYVIFIGMVILYDFYRKEYALKQ